MSRREPPLTDEGWYVLHDFRTIDWDAWRDASERTRERALDEGIAYLDAAESVSDAAEGDSAVYSIVGHDADLLVVHLRPAMADLDALQRRFEGTELAAFTEREHSFVSVTEVSGYLSPEYFEEGADAVDTGTQRYLETRMHPKLPDADHVCFYPMDKRRGETHNWYDLPFDDRAEHMSSHGEIGKKYAGKVTQIITGAIGFDDWEWGVTLFTDDPTQVKELLYEMRFDPSTSLYAEFGSFYFGQRFEPDELDAHLAGEPVPAKAAVSEDAEHPHGSGSGGHDGGEHPNGDGHHGGDGGHGHAGDHGHGEAGEESAAHGDDSTVAETDEGIREQLDDLDVYAGQPHGEDVFALVLYSEADADELFEEVDGLRSNFDHYDTHVKTAVYEPVEAGGPVAVASLWETASAADTAAGFLQDLSGVIGRAGDGDGFGTMGMFYTVKPDYRGEFVDTFEEVGGLLAEMDGHRETRLLANREQETDMFIDSRWDAKEDAMAFFRSSEFAETVEWGREVLDDKPRHVFLA